MISVFFPLFNEEQIVISSIEKTHQYLIDRNIEHEIIAVDNGSCDNTSSLCCEFAKNHDWFRFYSIKERGAGRAFVIGARAAIGQYIITLDIDLSSDMVFIDYAIDLLKYGEMVVGSKTLGKQRRGFIRIFGSQLYILCSQILVGLTLSDYSIGSKAYQRDLIIPFLDQLDPWTGYTLDLALHLNSSKKRIVQIGINCNDTRKSHFNLFHEGWYRFYHLWQAWRKFNTVKHTV